MSTTQSEQLATPVTPESEQSLVDRVDEVLADFAGEKAELISILQRVQHALGYLPDEAMIRIARFTRLPQSTVYGVATFYSQFKFAPVGRDVDQGVPGHRMLRQGCPPASGRSREAAGYHRRRDDGRPRIHPRDGRLLGSCALAPVLVLNERVYGSMTPRESQGLAAPQGRGGVRW